MNLHGIAGPAISVVNPFVTGTIMVSTGPGPTQPDGSRAPTFKTVLNVPMQVQSLTFRDIQQIDALNLQGTRRAIYVRGKVDGLVRADNKGGDLVILTDRTNAGTWKVAMVLESWPGWCKIAVVLQNSP